MKTRVCTLGFLAATMLLLATVAGAGAPSDCDRAAAIRKHVRASDTMPQDIKEELLAKASRLCPEKRDAAAALRKAEELYSQKKFSEALDQYQTAVELVPEKACAKVLKAARELKKAGKRALAKAFYEAGLSFCSDEEALEEYRRLAKESKRSLEAEGPGDLVPRDIIIESLREGQRRAHGRYGRYGRDDDENGRVVFHSILFESGSATLTPSSKDQLAELGEALRSPELADVDTFFICGHTDSIGTEARNCDLGYQRAKAVIRYLVDNWDIRPRRLVPVSFGQNQPIASNATPLGRLLNRRVEVKNGDVADLDDYRGERCR